MQSDAALRALSTTGAGKIRHVVYIVQENRSFNDVFQGYPGAYTVSSGRDSKGGTIELQPVSLAVHYLIDHSADRDVRRMPTEPESCRERSAGWTDSTKNSSTKRPRESSTRSTSTCRTANRSRISIWRTNGCSPTACSNRSSTRVSSPTNTSLPRKRSQSVNIPYGPWGCPPGPDDTVQTITIDRTYGTPQVPCFDYQTLGDELDAAGLSWRFYTSKYGTRASGRGAIWSSYQAVRHIYSGPDWKKDIVTPQKRFLTDVAAGKLADFTWITPVCDDSDHVSCGGGYGPSWVAALVNAVGESEFWDSTAIFVQWDDWGGIYDPVPPPFKDYDGLGFRVPLIVISAYAKHDYVSHVQYETASVLRFAEDLFGLGQLAAADKRATSPAADCFDFMQRPRRFVPIKAPKGRKFFLDQPDDYRIPDYE